MSIYVVGEEALGSSNVKSISLNKYIGTDLQSAWVVIGQLPQLHLVILAFLSVFSVLLLKKDTLCHENSMSLISSLYLLAIRICFS